jgi:hypothetical protein
MVNMRRANVLSAFFLLLWTTSGWPASPFPGLTSCSSGAGADQRQRCDDEAFKEVQTLSQSTQLDGGWRLVKSRNPGGGADAVSVMHAVDSAKSDIGLAGLSFQCGRHGVEMVLILLEPLPRSGRPVVILSAGSKQTEFEASVLQTGEALLLPQTASTLAIGEWQSTPELSVQINIKPGPIRGAVPIAGLSNALRYLSQNCPAR